MAKIYGDDLGSETFNVANNQCFSFGTPGDEGVGGWVAHEQKGFFDKVWYIFLILSHLERGNLNKKLRHNTKKKDIILDEKGIYIYNVGGRCQRNGGFFKEDKFVDVKVEKRDVW